MPALAVASLLDGVLAPTNPGCTATNCGSFAAPFAEPAIGDQATAAKCIPDSDGQAMCKPAAGTVALLHDGRVLYWDALEGTERVQFTVVLEFGDAAANDQSRLMTLPPSGPPTWSKPSPVDGGANAAGTANTPLLPFLNSNDEQGAGALFCSDLVQLADGRILAAGGTNYYSEPGIDGVPYGVIEIEGIKNTRIFHPADDHWAQTDSMQYGRWYPTLVTLPDGDVFVASGVTKLVKPIYPDQPFNSGRNVVQTETFDVGCGEWSENGPLGERSLPTYPRLHLLPNGHVFYNAAGQAFDPFGYGYDMALWNVVGSYDPQAKAWSDLAYAGLPLQLNQIGLEKLASGLNPPNPAAASLLMQTLAALAGTLTEDPAAVVNQAGALLGLGADPEVIDIAIGSGFRGSTFSTMLPLEPNAAGDYDKVELLTAGGVLGGVVAASPGSYLAVKLSRIDTIDLSGAQLGYRSRLTGDLNHARWYSSAVLLADGSVLALSGADRDEVALPGAGIPVKRAERFDPATERWSPMAVAHQARTYHNTAMLLADGRVLVGGHAPINTAYAFSITLPGFSPNDGRDPSFEIYSPPYVFRSDRPVIGDAPRELRHGQTATIRTAQASSIAKVLLIRRTATTHLVDADQRAVSLRIMGRSNGTVRVDIPQSRAVLPPGPYMLFVLRHSSSGLVPSVSAPVMVLGADAGCAS